MQHHAPLYEALLQHAQQDHGNFYVPGHKAGGSFDRMGKKQFASLLPLDATEINGLDDLHAPEGVIAEAQHLAAEAFGADETLFLVGGSTAGNLATILTVCKPGETILVQRNCHQSIFHGCLLAGAHPVYITSLDKKNGRERPIAIDELDSLINKYPQAKALIVTSPSYYGWVQPLDEIAKRCHQAGIPLIVDEAHGAHLGFHPQLPKSAMQSGADVAIQSTHKMLTSMTMSSMLHVKGNRIQGNEIAHWLRVIESSSPSYPLMASLDLARRYWMMEGIREMDHLLTDLQVWRESMRSFHYIKELEWEGETDLLKLNITANHLVSGFQLAQDLERNQCYAELADHEKVLLYLTVGTKEEDLQRLHKSLSNMDRALKNHGESASDRVHLPSFPVQPAPSLPLTEVRRRGSEWIPLDQAKGRNAAELVVPYPPGIPLLHSGEVWTDEAIDYIQRMIRLGGKVRGIYDSTLPYVRVLQ